MNWQGFTQVQEGGAVDCSIHRSVIPMLSEFIRGMTPTPHE